MQTINKIFKFRLRCFLFWRPLFVLHGANVTREIVCDKEPTTTKGEREREKGTNNRKERTRQTTDERWTSKKVAVKSNWTETIEAYSQKGKNADKATWNEAILINVDGERSFAFTLFVFELDFRRVFFDIHAVASFFSMESCLTLGLRIFIWLGNTSEWKRFMMHWFRCWWRRPIPMKLFIAFDIWTNKGFPS